MKKAFTFISLLCIGVLASAQPYANKDFVKMIQDHPDRAAVNSDPYEYGPVSDTKAPKGYKPFYISHYGRHGSRSDWGEPEYASVVDILTKAKAQGILTAGGDSLLNISAAVLKAHDGMDGRLTPRGAREHREIAERMYSRFKPVFKSDAKSIRAVSSTVPRCIVSMTAFTDGLDEIDPKLEISWDTGEKFMEYCSSDCSKETSKKVYAQLDSLDKSYVPDTVYTMKRLFTDQVAAHKLVPDVQAFEKNIFAVAKITSSFDIEESAFKYLPMDLIYKCWADIDLVLYLRQCNSKPYGDDRMHNVIPLVEDVIAKADEVIAGAPVAADLRFGHDYPTLALSSFLTFEGVGERYNLDEALQNFFGSLYTCFAANVQIIFYRNKSGDVLVKFLLNERETPLIAVKPFEGPYYKWNDVKAYLQSRIDSLK